MEIGIHKQITAEEQFQKVFSCCCCVLWVVFSLVSMTGCRVSSLIKNAASVGQQKDASFNKKYEAVTMLTTLEVSSK